MKNTVSRAKKRGIPLLEFPLPSLPAEREVQKKAACCLSRCGGEPFKLRKLLRLARHREADASAFRFPASRQKKRLSAKKRKNPGFHCQGFLLTLR